MHISESKSPVPSEFHPPPSHVVVYVPSYKTVQVSQFKLFGGAYLYLVALLFSVALFILACMPEEVVFVFGKEGVCHI